MQNPEFVPLAPKTFDVKAFDCGKAAINTYLHRYAAKNATLNLSRTFVLPYIPTSDTQRPQIAAYYTLAHQTLIREELPNPARLPR